MSTVTLRNVASAAMVASLVGACTPRLADAVPAPAEPEEFRGLFAHLGGASTLLPCDPTAAGPVAAVPVDPTPALLEAYARATRQGYPGQRVEVAFRGTRDAETGRIVVREHRTAAAKTPRGTCLPSELWALGNEPFWSLQISHAEGLAEWSAIGAPTVRYDYAAPSVQSEGKVRRYYFHGDQRLKATVTKATCEDATSGNRYPYRVRVERAGGVYEGCGE